MRKNPYDKILERESKEQHINIVPKSYSYIYIYISNAYIHPLT